MADFNHQMDIFRICGKKDLNEEHFRNKTLNLAQNANKTILSIKIPRNLAISDIQIWKLKLFCPRPTDLALPTSALLYHTGRLSDFEIQCHSCVFPQ